MEPAVLELVDGPQVQDVRSTSLRTRATWNSPSPVTAPSTCQRNTPSTIPTSRRVRTPCSSRDLVSRRRAATQRADERSPPARRRRDESSDGARTRRPRDERRTRSSRQHRRDAALAERPRDREPRQRARRASPKPVAGRRSRPGGDQCPCASPERRGSARPRDTRRARRRTSGARGRSDDEQQAPRPLCFLRPAVLVEEAELAAEVLDVHAGRRAMRRRRARPPRPGRTTPASRRAGSGQPVGLLAEQEEALVEQPDRVGRLAAHEQGGAREPVDLAGARMVEPAGVERVEQRRSAARACG